MLYPLVPLLAKLIIVSQEREGNSVQGWALVCDTLLTRSAGPGTVFQVNNHNLNQTQQYTKNLFSNEYSNDNLKNQWNN